MRLEVDLTGVRLLRALREPPEVVTTGARKELTVTE